MSKTKCQSCVGTQQSSGIWGKNVPGFVHRHGDEVVEKFFRHLPLPPKSPDHVPAQINRPALDVRQGVQNRDPGFGGAALAQPARARGLDQDYFVVPGVGELMEFL
jgi:hypothetical protein